jgi:hypothetical protein
MEIHDPNMFISNHTWSFQDCWLVYTMYRLNIFSGYKNSLLDFIVTTSGISKTSINAAYKNLEHLDGQKGLSNASRNLKQIHSEQRTTSLSTLVQMIDSDEIRERLLRILP